MTDGSGVLPPLSTCRRLCPPSSSAANARRQWWSCLTSEILGPGLKMSLVFSFLPCDKCAGGAANKTGGRNLAKTPNAGRATSQQMHNPQFMCFDCSIYIVFNIKKRRNCLIVSSCQVARASSRHPAQPQAHPQAESCDSTDLSPGDEPQLANEIIEHDRLPYSDHGQYPSQKHHPPRDLFVHRGRGAGAQLSSAGSGETMESSQTTPHNGDSPRTEGAEHGHCPFSALHAAPITPRITKTISFG